MMDRVPLKIWAEQDGRHTSIFVKAGDDPVVELMRYDRAWMRERSDNSKVPASSFPLPSIPSKDSEK